MNEEGKIDYKRTYKWEIRQEPYLVATVPVVG